MPQDEPQLQWNTAQALDSLDPAERALAARLAEARYVPVPFGPSWHEMTVQELAGATLEAAWWIRAARDIGLIK